MGRGDGGRRFVEADRLIPFELWREYVRAEVRPQLLTFFTPLFSDETAAAAFIDTCHDRNVTDYRPMRLLHTTERLISLGDDASGLRDNADAIQVMFWHMCIEALQEVVQPGSSKGKTKLLAEFFLRYSTQEDLRILIDGICLPRFDVKPNRTKRERVFELATFLSGIRNAFAHEGRRIPCFPGVSQTNLCIVKVPMFEPKTRRFQGYRDATYDISISREQTRAIILRTCKRMIETYLR